MIKWSHGVIELGKKVRATKKQKEVKPEVSEKDESIIELVIPPSPVVPEVAPEPIPVKIDEFVQSVSKKKKKKNSYWDDKESEELPLDKESIK